MEEWLKQHGFYLGNALLSGMGLAFAIGAPASLKFSAVKKWWIVLWASLAGFYLWSALLFPTSSIIVLILAAVFNGSSTSAAAMLNFNLHDNKQIKTKKSVIVFSSILLLVTLSALLSQMIYGYSRYLVGVVGQVVSWIFFVLLAWNYRKLHMATTILLLAYANLQLPAGLIGKEGWGNDFVLLLAAKLSLIGAMYHTLGVRDAKS
jgi:hypothetical protein